MWRLFSSSSPSIHGLLNQHDLNSPIHFCILNIVVEVKVIFAVVKQLKQLQRKPRKKSRAFFQQLVTVASQLWRLLSLLFFTRQVRLCKRVYSFLLSCQLTQASKTKMVNILLNSQAGAKSFTTLVWRSSTCIHTDKTNIGTQSRL